LEALEHGDVLGRVAGLRLSLRHTQEMPAKPTFCEALEVYQKARLERSLASAKPTAFCTLSRRFSSSTDEAIARARSASSGATSSAEGGSSRPVSGSGPGANFSPGTPSVDAISAERWPGSNAQIESAGLTETVQLRGIRAGHAFRAMNGPTAAGQRSTTSAIPACGPNRDSASRTSSPSRSTFHLHDLCRIQRQRTHVRRGDHRLAHLRNTLDKGTPSAEAELRKHAVQAHERRRGPRPQRDEQP